MNLDDTPQQAVYRAQVRAWIDAHRDQAPPPISGIHMVDPEAHGEWQAKLADAGLAGVTWPRAYGGSELGTAEQLIAGAELSRAGCRGSVVVDIIGPTLLAHGTEEQRERYLRPMLRGEESWCQLFSEPAAGSDLAGVQTRAVPAGGGFALSGQKVWTTGAQHADFGLALVRTNPDAPKHKGLSMVVVDMRADGVTVRPLRGISGDAAFNEVFLDEVHTDAVVGEVDSGWAVALTTLMFERAALMSTFVDLGFSAERFAGAIADHPGVGDTHVRQRLAEVTCGLLALRYSSYRALTALERGGVPGPEASLGKLGMIEAARLGCELIADLLGPDALMGEWWDTTCDMPGLRSGGGTEEVLRSTVGERVLGLPREPRAEQIRVAA